MPSGGMKIEKIDDGADPKPVDDVAERSAYDKAQANSFGKGLGTQSPYCQHDDDEKHEAGKQRRRIGKCLVEQAKTYAGVEAEAQVKEGQHGNNRGRLHHDVHDQPFRALIDRKPQESGPQHGQAKRPIGAHGH